MKALLRQVLIVFLFLVITHTVFKGIDSLHTTQEDVSLEEPKEKDQQGRAEYFEFLNTGGADFDWKEEYAKQRREKAKTRQERQNRMIRSGGSVPPTESFGNGSLNGFWKERGANNQAGRIVASDVMESRDLIIFGSDGGTVFVGDVAGNEYDIINDRMQFKIITVHSFELNSGDVRIIVVDAAGVYYTDNMGQTWENSLNKGLQQGVTCRANDKLYIMDKSGGIHESTNQGETFKSIGSVPVKTNTSGDAYTSLWTPRYSEGPLYILTAADLYTYDNGSLAKKGTVDGSVSSPYKVSITGSDDTSVLFCTMNKKVYKSTNGGSDWTKVHDGPTTLFGLGGVMNNFHYASYDNALYFGGSIAYRSDDQGANWTGVHYYGQYDSDRVNYPHVDHCDTRSFRDSKGIPFTVLNHDGGSHITYDNKTYRNITLSQMTNSQYYGTLTRWEDPDYVLAGAQDQGVQLSMPDSSDTDILNFKLFIGGDNGGFTSSDSGKSAWYQYQSGDLYYHPDTRYPQAYNGRKPNGGTGFIFMAPTMADPDNPKKVYIGGSGLYYMTYNGPNSFSSGTHGSSNFDNSLTALAYSPIDNSHWYAATRSGSFYHSSDRGTTWSQVASNFAFAHGYVGHGIVADPNVPGRVYVCGNGNNGPSVFVSDTHGQNLTELAGSPRTTATKLAITPDSKYLFASTVTGPYVYIADEDEWFDLAGNNAPDNIYLSVEYIPTAKIARFGTYGRGIWDFNVDVAEPVTSGTAITTEKLSFVVKNNKLSFTVAGSENITLKLFTPAGREVLRKELQAKVGINSINLNLYNLAKGFYLAGIECGSEQVVQKISIQ